MCLSYQVADSVAHLQLERLRYVCLQTFVQRGQTDTHTVIGRTHSSKHTVHTHHHQSALLESLACLPHTHTQSHIPAPINLTL